MENSCRKKYKPSPKKWILASRYSEFRRNPALIPANAGLFHYAGNNPVRYIDPDGRKVIVGISTSDSFWGRIFGEHAFIMVINEDIPEKSLMLDASGHYGGNRSSDILDGYLIGISVEAYLRYWDTDEKLTTFELVLTKDEEGKIKNAISKIEGRSWMSCASIASEVLNENFSSEIEECCTPIGLLESLMKYEKKHSDKVIIKNYSLKTDQEIKDGKE